ncbi:Alkyl hydroperoxide reductase subunit C-like protein [plant metagenome]|uniref:thioredoxin-dependent peroxiredoxin n=1 Tax=plant metagenome TaxID=1297885 RepID=A0A484NYY8_9ZZZZ
MTALPAIALRPTRRLVTRAALAVSLLGLAGAHVLPAAHAALSAGAQAPTFTAEAALAGKPFTFDLAQALKEGPVVLYFYPAAFTQGCTIEAHLFAEATDTYKSMGATVIGVSGDDLETLKKFSVSACGGKFAVAADSDHSIMKNYDVAHAVLPGVANRVSFVISPEGKVLYQYASGDPSNHVKNTMEAVRAWHQGAHSPRNNPEKK